MTNWAASRAIGGITAATTPPTTTRTSMMTVTTAAHRGTHRRASTDTAGSRPMARNNANYLGAVSGFVLKMIRNSVDSLRSSWLKISEWTRRACKGGRAVADH